MHVLEQWHCHYSYYCTPPPSSGPLYLFPSSRNQSIVFGELTLGDGRAGSMDQFFPVLSLIMHLLALQTTMMVCFRETFCLSAVIMMLADVVEKPVVGICPWTNGIHHMAHPLCTRTHSPPTSPFPFSISVQTLILSNQIIHSSPHPLFSLDQAGDSPTYVFHILIWIFPP